MKLIPCNNGEVYILTPTELKYVRHKEAPPDKVYDISELGPIPRIIHQTWVTKQLPAGMQAAVDALKAANPGWDHRIYNDEFARRFIIKHFDSHVTWAYDTLIPGTYKADLFRYCVMYVHGGVYLDIKYAPVDGFSFESWLPNETYVLEFGPFVYQGCFMCPPRHPRLLDAINTVVKNVRLGYYGDCHVCTTGPHMFGRLFTYEERSTLNYAYRNNGVEVFDRKTGTVLLRQYTGYREYQKETYEKAGTKYWSTMWEERNIFDIENYNSRHCPLITEKYDTRLTVEMMETLVNSGPKMDMNKQVPGDIPELCTYSDDTIRVNPQPCLLDKKILVIGLARNISGNIGNIQRFYHSLKDKFEGAAFFYITNNNTDNTVDILTKWESNDNTVRGYNAPPSQISLENRTRQFALLRDELVQRGRAHMNDCDYILMLDLDVESNISLDGFLSCFTLADDWDIICANAEFNDNPYHYDVFALRLLTQPDDITSIYSDFTKFYGTSTKWLDKLYNFESFYRVKSAFGGAMLFRAGLDIKWYNDKLTGDICEHLIACANKKVYINDKFRFKMNYSIDILEYAYKMYIPRDGGFFSNFNFMVGACLTTHNIIPAWTRNLYNLRNSSAIHFTYFSDDNDENIFLRYFDYKISSPNPVKKIVDYATAPLEMREPSITSKLMKSDEFQSFRDKMHVCYKSFISPKEKIMHDVRQFIASYKDTPLVGVHYRNPVHMVESGKVLFKDYFDYIDSIVTPNSKLLLATDTELAVAAFSMRYPNKIICFNNDKTTLDDMITWIQDLRAGGESLDGTINSKGYESHHKHSSRDKCYDIIFEMFCLAHTSHFIGVPSNISLALSYINPTLPMKIL
jgi:hypothetical protein